MLEHLLLLLLTGPLFPEPHTPYPSGVSEVEHSYPSDLPAKDYPLLTLDVLAHDGRFNIVKPGVYAVEALPDLKTLLLQEGNKTIAKSPVVQIIELEKEQPFPVARVTLVKNELIFIMYRADKLELHGFLYRAGESP